MKTSHLIPILRVVLSLTSVETQMVENQFGATQMTPKMNGDTVKQLTLTVPRDYGERTELITEEHRQELGLVFYAKIG